MRIRTILAGASVLTGAAVVPPIVAGAPGARSAGIEDVTIPAKGNRCVTVRRQSNLPDVPKTVPMSAPVAQSTYPIDTHGLSGGVFKLTDDASWSPNFP